MIPKYKLIERVKTLHKDNLTEYYSVDSRTVCTGDLQMCLDTLFNCEVSNIDSNDSCSKDYIIEREEN